jgi:hypothetical protein
MTADATAALAAAHHHRWSDIPKRSEVMLPFRQVCNGCGRVRAVKQSRGDIAATIDRLLSRILPPDFDREEALWPLIYEYAAATSRRDALPADAVPDAELRKALESLCVSWHTSVPVDIIRAALAAPTEEER